MKPFKVGDRVKCLGFSDNRGFLEGVPNKGEEFLVTYVGENKYGYPAIGFVSIHPMFNLPGYGLELIRAGLVPNWDPGIFQLTESKEPIIMTKTIKSVLDDELDAIALRDEQQSLRGFTTEIAHRSILRQEQLLKAMYKLVEDVSTSQFVLNNTEVLLHVKEICKVMGINPKVDDKLIDWSRNRTDDNKHEALVRLLSDVSFAIQNTNENDNE